MFPSCVAIDRALCCTEGEGLDIGKWEKRDWVRKERGRIAARKEREVIAFV